MGATPAWRPAGLIRLIMASPGLGPRPPGKADRQPHPRDSELAALPTRTREGPNQWKDVNR